jgi:thymidine phosphorylase
MRTSDERRLPVPADGVRPHRDAAVRNAIALVRLWTAEAPVLVWDATRVVDRHGLDRIPGHRTTPIVAAIVAAAGATMPHFSLPADARAWSTADAMATLTDVEIDRVTASRVVSREGACIARAGTAGVGGQLPWTRAADDAHLVASALSRRLAAGIAHLLINVTVGRAAAVPDDARLHRLQDLFAAAGAAVGLRVRIARSAGSQPVGLGVGPAPEALDVLAVLRGAAAAPVDLRMRALAEAGQLLEMCGRSRPGHGEADARQLLDSGVAWSRFQAICEAQGGFREPTLAPHVETVTADQAGYVRSLDGAHVQRVAVLAGAPCGTGAGIVLHTRIGDRVERGQPLFTVHAASEGQRAAVVDDLRHIPLVAVIGDAALIFGDADAKHLKT